MKKNKAPGPEFYQIFWNVVKVDLMALFDNFRRVIYLSFAKIWHHRPSSQKENVIQIQQYRPICLLNVSFKIITKVGTNRLTREGN
jgi:hypothetical protein